jgi:hypothetical protein
MNAHTAVAKARAALSDITVQIRKGRIDWAAPVSLVIGGLLTWAGIALLAWPLAYLVYLW